MHISGKKQIRRLECSLQSGSVTIEQEVNPRRKTMKKGHLVRSDGRSERSHRIIEPGNRQRHDIHVALYHESRLSSADRVLRPTQAVEDSPFVVDRRFGGVNVLGRSFPSGTQHAATETHDLPGQTLDGKDEPATESVVGILAFFTTRNQAHFDQNLFPDSVVRCRLEKPTPRIRSVADPEPLSRLSVDPPLLQVGSRRAAGRFVPEQVLEKHASESVRLVEVTKRVFTGLTPAHFSDLDSASSRHMLDRVHEAEAVMFREERKNITGFTAPEAVVETLCRDHIEARRLFVVEWAAGLVVLTGLFQRYDVANHLNDVGTCANLVDLIVGNHQCPFNGLLVSPP